MCLSLHHLSITHVSHGICITGLCRMSRWMFTHSFLHTQTATWCILYNEYVWQCMQHALKTVTEAYHIMLSLLITAPFIFNLNWNILWFFCATVFIRDFNALSNVNVCVCERETFSGVVGVRSRKGSVCYKDRLVPTSRRRHYDDCHGDGVWVTGGITRSSRGAGSQNCPSPWH